MTETRPHHQIIGPESETQELIERIRAGVEDRTELSEEEAEGVLFEGLQEVLAEEKAAGDAGVSGPGNSNHIMGAFSKEPKSYEKGAFLSVPRDHAGAVCWPPTWDPKEESQSVKECGQEYRDAPATGQKPRKAYTLNDILRLWIIGETGRLTHPIHKAGRDTEAADADTELLAWLWVEKTPGWCQAVHEVMRHIFVRGKTWDEWPRFAHRTARMVDLPTFGPYRKGELPRFVSEWEVVEVPISVPRSRAVNAWKKFRPELERRVIEDPFYGEIKSAPLA